jgi:hypothetical protein
VNGYLTGFLAILTGIAVAIIGELLSEEIRDRLDQVPRAILRFAARWLDPNQRTTVYRDEWEPELIYILKGAEARPITRLVIGIRYAFGILINTRRIARHLHRSEPGQPHVATGSPTATRNQRFLRPHRRNFLVILAGANTEILEFFPSERVKFAILGAVIVTASSFAATSMCFALNSVIGINIVFAILISILWGLAIMLIDRMTVISVAPGSARRFLIAIARVAFAILLGVIIAIPIMLQIFRPVINFTIPLIRQQNAAAFAAAQRHSPAAQQVTKFADTVNDLKKVIDSGGAAASSMTADPLVRSMTRQLDAELSLQQGFYQLWQCQLHSDPGCTGSNAVPALSARASYNQVRQQVTTLTDGIRLARYKQAVTELPAAQKQLHAASDRETALQANFNATNKAANSLSIRLQALNLISNRYFTVGVARWLLFLFFVVIECLPVMLRLLQSSGLYEEALRQLAVVLTRP